MENKNSNKIVVFISVLAILGTLCFGLIYNKTYNKDNTNKEYGPISNADIKGKQLVVLNAKHIIIYFITVFICLGYLIINILLGVKEMKKNSEVNTTS